ncbi:ankyrin repeat-containing domain protein [Gorgonomyces haynaldii]|nr:ankyrin repeat-containing domain protein [Gorgonomyces haynaldii]
MDLPTELVQQITQHLEPRDYLRFYSTCKQLYHKRLPYQFRMINFDRLLYRATTQVLNQCLFPETLNLNSSERQRDIFRKGITQLCSRTLNMIDIELAAFYLAIAAEAGHLEICSMVLERYDVANQVPAFGEEAAYRVADNGSIPMMQLLLDHGLLLRVRSSGDSPLHRAASKARSEMIEFLVDKGMSVNCHNGNRVTPLHCAAQAGSVETVRCLLERGADPKIPDSKGRTPLIWAAEQGHGLVCELLLDQVVNTRDRKGNTPFVHALRSNYYPTCDLLLQHGALADVLDSHSQRPLYKCARLGEREQLKYLLSKGVDPNARSKGETALHIAVQYGHRDICQILLDHGADINALNKWQQSPLQVALTHYRLYIAQLLIQRGATITKRLYLQTPRSHVDLSLLLQALCNDTQTR